MEGISGEEKILIAIVKQAQSDIFSHRIHKLTLQELIEAYKFLLPFYKKRGKVNMLKEAYLVKKEILERNGILW